MRGRDGEGGEDGGGAEERGGLAPALVAVADVEVRGEGRGRRKGYEAALAAGLHCCGSRVVTRCG